MVTAGVQFDLSGLGSVVPATPAAVRSLPRLPPRIPPPPRRRRLLSYSFSCSDLTTTKTRLPDKEGNDNGNDNSSGLRCRPKSTILTCLEKKGSESGSGLDSNSAGSDYLSFQGSDCDEGDGKGEEEEEEEEEQVVPGEREQRMILEDAGLILRVGGDDARVKSLDKDKDKEIGLTSGQVGLREVLEKTIRLGDDDEDGKEKKKEGGKKRRRRSLPAVPVGPRALSLTRGQQSQVAVSDIDPSDESSIVDSDSTVSTMPQHRRRLKRMVSNAISAKDLPPIPLRDDDGDGDDINRRISKLSTSSSWSSSSSPPTLTISKRTFDPDEHAKRLDDAFERYESFKKAHLAASYNNNRLSVVSATSTDSSLVYPPLSPTMLGASVMTPTSSKGFETGNLHPRPHRHHRFSANLSALPYGLHSHISHGKSEESPTGMSPPGGSRYSQLLQFLSIGRAKTPEHESGAGRKVTISGPMAVNSMSGEGDGSLDGGNVRPDSPAFGSVSSEVPFRGKPCF